MTDARIADLKIHPAAQKFPEMGQEELNRLFEDIKKHGVQIPIILYDGQLVDGRNRVRASLMLGVPWTQLPKVHLPKEADPFALAWSRNCERLDYSPSLKAKIKLEIEKESAGLDERRRASEEAANEKRSKATKAQPRANDGTMKPKSAGVPPHGGTPVSAAKSQEKSETRKADLGMGQVEPSSQPPPRADPRKNSTAAKLASEAGVSQRTMERVMGRISNGGSKRGVLPKLQKPNANWSVPRNIDKMAAFLLERLPSDEVRQLARLLLNNSSEDAMAGAR